MSEFVEDEAFKSQTWGGRGKENTCPLSLKKTRAKRSNSAALDLPSKRPRLPLKPILSGAKGAEAGPSTSWFDFSSSDYSEMAVPFVPANTKKNNEWAYNGVRIAIFGFRTIFVLRILLRKLRGIYLYWDSG